jgi:DNA repair exonuclease SbcCD nuclease subunit
MFKFIHAADLHIDSPLRGLEAYPGAPVEQLRAATRDAFEKLVTLAIEQQVAFVIIAGDLFDGKWQDTKTGLWTAGQFRRLEREEIGVYILRGNHDAASKVSQAVTWPSNVHEFSDRKPETFHLKSIDVALHGQGFRDRECTQDLAADYPKSVRGAFNIGVLHTSLTGFAEHDPYAPTDENVLVGKGYDYWALGHIHQRSDPPIREEPFIAYSGNTQGRHIRETGPRGCLLNTVDHGELVNFEFMETDVLRWHLADVELNESAGLAELHAAVRATIAACHDECDGRFSAIRVAVRGACEAHRELVDRVKREEALAEIRNQASDLDENIWIEKIKLQTSAPVDIEQLRQGSDLVADLLAAIDELRDDDDQLAELASELAPLAAKAASELSDSDVNLDDAEQLRGWIEEAESLLVSRLAETQG